MPLAIMILSYYVKTMEKALAPETRPAALPADHEGGDRGRGRPAGQRQPLRVECGGVLQRCGSTKDVALQLDCGAININDVISNMMCTTAPMGGWKTSGIGARFGGADGIRKFCRQETVVVPRTSAGAGGNYYNNSLKALTRMNKLMTKIALARPKQMLKYGTVRSSKRHPCVPRGR